MSTPIELLNNAYGPSDSDSGWSDGEDDDSLGYGIAVEIPQDEPSLDRAVTPTTSNSRIRKPINVYGYDSSEEGDDEDPKPTLTVTGLHPETREIRHPFLRKVCGISAGVIFLMALACVWILPAVVEEEGNDTTDRDIFLTPPPISTDDDSLPGNDDNIFDNGILIAIQNPTREEILEEVLEPVTPFDILTENGTAQNAALLWLANDDPAHLIEEDRSLDGGFITVSSEQLRILQDRYRVALLHFSLSGNYWRKPHGFLNESNVCSWNDGGDGGAFEGIGCSDGDVVEIVLDMNVLRGSIPKEICGMSKLEVLGFGANSIEGTIPTELGLLTNLEWLSLSGNFLTGSIPTELAQLTKLETLLLCK